MSHSTFCQYQMSTLFLSRIVRAWFLSTSTSTWNFDISSCPIWLEHDSTFVNMKSQHRLLPNKISEHDLSAPSLNIGWHLLLPNKVQSQQAWSYSAWINRCRHRALLKNIIEHDLSWLAVNTKRCRRLSATKPAGIFSRKTIRHKFF